MNPWLAAYNDLLTCLMTGGPHAWPERYDSVNQEVVLVDIMLPKEVAEKVQAMNRAVADKEPAKQELAWLFSLILKTGIDASLRALLPEFIERAAERHTKHEVSINGGAA